MLAENFKRILTDYKIKDHNVSLDDTSIVDEIENNYEDVLKDFIKDYGDFNTKFTCLNGDTLLRVPFATIYDKRYEDFNNGLFIGFSFYPDKGLVYLKIDQGLVKVGGNFNLPFVRGMKLRTFIGDIPEEFEFREGKSAPGNIIGKNYTLDTLSDSILKEDLDYVFNVYKTLVPEFDNIVPVSFEDIVDSLDL